MQIAFVEGTISGIHKCIPSTSVDGSLARQVSNGRPLPSVVYVKMDNEKIDTTLFPDRIVAFTPQERHVTKTHGGKNIVTRQVDKKIPVYTICIKLTILYDMQISNSSYPNFLLHLTSF